MDYSRFIRSDLQEISSEELRQVARLHKEGINKGFLSSLGVNFLTLLYAAINISNGAVLILVQKDGEVIGFVAGTVNGMGEIYRLMLKRWFYLALVLLPVILNPRKVFKVFETLLHSRKLEDKTLFPKSELLSISVAQSARGSGVASLLYIELKNQFAVRGVSKFKIVVGDSLQDAHSFYRKMGATPFAKIEVHKGYSSTVYSDEV